MALNECRSDRHFADAGQGIFSVVNCELSNLNSPVSGSAECKLRNEGRRSRSGAKCNEGFLAFSEKSRELENNFGSTEDIAIQLKLVFIVTKKISKVIAPRLVIRPLSILHCMSLLTNSFMRWKPSPRHALSSAQRPSTRRISVKAPTTSRISMIHPHRSMNAATDMRSSAMAPATTDPHARQVERKTQKLGRYQEWLNL